MKDLSTPDDQRKEIDFLNFMMYGGDWYIHTIHTVHEGAHTVRYAMAARLAGSKTPGQLIVSKGEPYDPPKKEVTTVGNVRLLSYKANEVIAIQQVKIVGPGLTVGEFTKFITDRKMEDYEYVEGRGCRFWFINVLAELEKAGYVPAESTKRFLEFNRERHKELPHKIDEEIRVGHFNEYKPIWMPSKQ